MLPTAYLRIFHPVDSLGWEERTRWERVIVSGGPRPGPRRVYREQFSAAGGRVGVITSTCHDHADVRFVGGRHWVCPPRTRLRLLTSIVSLRETTPEMAGVLVPDTETRRAERELARLRRRYPSVRSPILQSAWHVPVRWFVLVDEGERHLVRTDRGGWRLYYWTRLLSARRRVADALEALGRTDLDQVSDGLGELGEWLSSFRSECAVELDYASVSDLFTWDQLDDDHSAGDVQEALRAIREGHGATTALDLYHQVATRWAEARSRESLN